MHRQRIRYFHPLGCRGAALRLTPDFSRRSRCWWKAGGPLGLAIEGANVPIKMLRATIEAFAVRRPQPTAKHRNI